MLVLFRHSNKKYAYDTVAGSLSAVGALEFRMLEALTPPMPPVCPTALRYELAKYDSTDVEENYAILYEKAADGVIFSPENGTLRLPEAEEELQRKALLIASERLTAPVTPTGSNTELIREILGARNLLT